MSIDSWRAPSSAVPHAPRVLGPLVLAVLGGLLVASAARAGGGLEAIRFELEFFEHGAAEPVQTATIWVADRLVRIEQRSVEGPADGSTLIFRGDRDRLYGVSDRARSYVDLERNALTRLDASRRVARREVSGQLAGLPGDQRKALERLLGVSRQETDRLEHPVVVTREGEAGEVSGFACETAVLRRAGHVLGEACVAPWEQMGLDAADVGIFRVLANFQRDLMGTQGETPLELVPDQPLDLIAQLDGLPLRFERRVDGRPRSAIRLRAVARVREAAALFEPPPGYVRRTGPNAWPGLVARARDAATASTGGGPAAPDPAVSDAARSAGRESAALGGHETTSSGAGRPASRPSSTLPRGPGAGRRHAPPPGASIRLFP